MQRGQIKIYNEIKWEDMTLTGEGTVKHTEEKQVKMWAVHYNKDSEEKCSANHMMFLWLEQWLSGQ